MHKRILAARILAVLGSLLLWLPILAPLIFGLIRLARAGWFSFDFLMPAEFFPVALAGCVLLIVAALLARSYRGPIVSAVVIALAGLGGGMLLAQVSGLASGEMEPQGIWWALVVALFVVYILALVAAGVGGVLLLRRLFTGPRPRPAIA